MATQWKPGQFDAALIDRLIAARHAKDVTPYARFIGYAGKKRVVVSDGKVITHKLCDWFEWIDRIRRRFKACETSDSVLAIPRKARSVA